MSARRVLALAAILAVVVTGCGGRHPRATPSGPPAGPTSVPVSHTVSSSTGQTLIATLAKPVPKSSSPGGAVTGTVPATWLGAVSALPVIAQVPGWIEVRLAQRPDESTAWIPTRDAMLTTTPYRIVVDLATRHLELLRLGKVVLDAPAGIGTAQDPTPTGQYFVAMFAQPPSTGYGPFVMVTSAHSDTITDWEQSGDAIIAIHGPLGADAAIGTTGAQVSHGCVRLHDTDLQQLRNVPAGSPIDIVG